MLSTLSAPPPPSPSWLRPSRGCAYSWVFFFMGGLIVVWLILTGGSFSTDFF